MKKFISVLLSIGLAVLSTSCLAADSEKWKSNLGTINLDKMTVSGSGVSISDNIITITEGGDFEVTGTLDDGMIYIKSDESVKLRLSGADITNSSGPAIFFENVKKGFITITENTENFLTDAEKYEVEGANAALFSNDDLEIKGSGTLNINALYKHGIAGDDDVKIENGVINISSYEHCIKVNDTLSVTGGTLNLTSETGKGIKAGLEVIIDNGDLNITSLASEGIESKGTLTVNGGNMSITSHDDGINTGNDDTQTEGTGEADAQMRPQRPMEGENNAPPEIPDEGNMPGRDNMMKGNPKGDGFKDKGQGRNPSQFGAPPEMPDGQMPRENLSEDMNENPTGNNRPMGGGFGRVDEETAAAHALTINGGNIYINAGGDGIDSNGNLTITGGTIVIDGPESTGNGPIDSDGAMSITGGEISMLSSGGMLQLPAAADGQNILRVAFNAGGSANDKITLKNSDGGEITTHTAAKKYSSWIYISPELVAGKEYTVYVNDEPIHTFTLSEGTTFAGNTAGVSQGTDRMKGQGGRKGGEQGISVSVDGQNVSFDTSPVMKNDTTLVGFRAVSELLGADVSWDEKSRTVTAVKGDTTIKLTINSNIANVNGTDYTLLTAPEIIGNSTMIPVRFISEHMDMDVEWIEPLNHVKITSRR